MSIPLYLNLRITARERLAALRKANPAAPLSARAYGFANWRAAFCALSQGFNSEGRPAPVWYTHCGQYFRHECFADEVSGVRIDHKGWYTDGDHCSEIARGIVAMLPHGRFIAGYWSSNGERVYYPELFDDEADAARMADEHARVYGERESEYSMRWSEARRIEDSIDEALTRLREVFTLRNNPCFKYAREEARECIGRIRDARAKLANFADVL